MICRRHCICSLEVKTVLHCKFDTFIYAELDMHVLSSLRCTQQVALSVVLASIAFCVQAAPDAGSLLREHENIQRQIP